MENREKKGKKKFFSRGGRKLQPIFPLYNENLLNAKALRAAGKEHRRPAFRGGMLTYEFISPQQTEIFVSGILEFATEGTPYYNGPIMNFQRYNTKEPTR